MRCVWRRQQVTWVAVRAGLILPINLTHSLNNAHPSHTPHPHQDAGLHNGAVVHVVGVEAPRIQGEGQVCRARSIDAPKDELVKGRGGGTGFWYTCSSQNPHVRLPSSHDLVAGHPVRITLLGRASIRSSCPILARACSPSLNCRNCWSATETRTVDDMFPIWIVCKCVVKWT